MNLEIMSNTGRSPGGMQWSGLPNLFWWLSPADGICGCYFTQILPPGDRMSLSLYSDFEAAVLKEWREGGFKGRGGLLTYHHGWNWPCRFDVSPLQNCEYHDRGIAERKGKGIKSDDGGGQ